VWRPAAERAVAPPRPGRRCRPSGTGPRSDFVDPRRTASQTWGTFCPRRPQRASPGPDQPTVRLDRGPGGSGVQPEHALEVLFGRGRLADRW